jgi:hypothetical protein
MVKRKAKVLEADLDIKAMLPQIRLREIRFDGGLD